MTCNWPVHNLCSDNDKNTESHNDINLGYVNYLYQQMFNELFFISISERDIVESMKSLEVTSKYQISNGKYVSLNSKLTFSATLVSPHSKQIIKSISSSH